VEGLGLESKEVSRSSGRLGGREYPRSLILKRDILDSTFQYHDQAPKQQKEDIMRCNRWLNANAVMQTRVPLGVARGGGQGGRRWHDPRLITPTLVDGSPTGLLHRFSRFSTNISR
jgi:hypothetical protein